MELISETPVFVLCGGLGTRIKEETELKPKPMVPIGKYPILWHLLSLYRLHGFRKFILCTGFKSEVIKSYFLNYHSMHSDFTVDLSNNALTVHSTHHEEDWEVTVAFTGEETMTGGRLAIAQKYLGNSPYAAVTYGDGLTNANLREEFLFHIEQNTIGTVLGVNPPSRFGELKIEGPRALEFDEKPEFNEKWINGGFFFFKREFFTDYLRNERSLVLEKEPLVKLAKDGELSVFKHPGFWACMDTQRDRDQLTELWNTGRAPWTHTAGISLQNTKQKAHT